MKLSTLDSQLSTAGPRSKVERRKSVFFLVSFAAVAIAGAAGCRPAPAGPEKPRDENAIVSTSERGPVKVVLRVEPREPTFAERVRFTIEATARKGVEVTLPQPGENLGDFIIKDYDSAPERVTADGTEHRRSYVLEFLTSGEYKIPPMTIAFRDRRQAGEAGAEGAPPVPGEEKKEPVPTSVEGEKTEESASEEPEFKIVTEEITVKVKPLADTASLKDLSPIAPPAEPPPIPARLAWPLGIAGGLAAAAALAFAASRLLRRERPPPPPIPPHERAYQELEWLLGQGFLDRGELKEFFFHLSRILREYIENRFGLRAPERTTEEFLEELGRGAPEAAGPLGQRAAIPRDHQRLLREFLERADLVKFALYAPERQEIESSFEAAKRFIEESRSSFAGGPGAPREPEEVAGAGRP